jgi:DNA recombination protein Rad52
MAFTPEQVSALQSPLDRSKVRTRTQQRGPALSYIEGWVVIDEANRIFGFDSWAREVVQTTCVADSECKLGRAPDQYDGWAVTYICRVRITVDTADLVRVVREGTGAGHGYDRNRGLAHESAIKEAETDAMKRALMTFGNPFGLALYDKTQSNVSDTASAAVAAPPAPPKAPPRPAKAPAKAATPASPELSPDDSSMIVGLLRELPKAQLRAFNDEFRREFQIPDDGKPTSAHIRTEAHKAFAERFLTAVPA